MKKYKATECHPFIEKGTEFEYCEPRHRMILVNSNYEFPLPPINIEDWIEQGFIEEIQEPEYTKDQLRDHCISFALNISSEFYNDIERKFNQWFKDKGQ